MKKIFFFAAALLASMTVLAADPTYESFDWASADAMAEGIAGDATVSIAVVTSGSNGNGGNGIGRRNSIGNPNADTEKVNCLVVAKVRDIGSSVCQFFSLTTDENSK